MKVVTYDELLRYSHELVDSDIKCVSCSFLQECQDKKAYKCMFEYVSPQKCPICGKWVDCVDDEGDSVMAPLASCGPCYRKKETW